MADTIRSLAELNALFADNGQGNITPQDIRDLVVSTMVHAEIGSGAKAAITLAAGFNVLALDVAGAVGRGITVDTANRRLSGIPVAMKAVVHAEINFSGAQNTTYTFAVFQNGVQVQRLTRTARPSAVADIRQVSFSTSLQCAVDDTFDLRVSAGMVSFTLLFGVLRVQRIGVE